MYELVEMINTALAMEYAATIQYNQHAEVVRGLYAEPIIGRLKDDSADETRHAGVLCTLLGDYLYSVPDVAVAPDIKSLNANTEPEEVINANIETERKAIAQYKTILAFLYEHKDDESIAPVYERIEHDIRHILMEEQEHVAELERLL